VRARGNDSGQLVVGVMGLISEGLRLLVLHRQFDQATGTGQRGAGRGGLEKTAACRVEDVVNGEGYRFHDQWAPAVGAADDVRKRISEWRGRRRAHSGVTSGMPGQELRA
jgi:hypothetical protein